MQVNMHLSDSKRTFQVRFRMAVKLSINDHRKCTALQAKSESDVMFCLQSYQGLIIDTSLVY